MKFPIPNENPPVHSKFNIKNTYSVKFFWAIIRSPTKGVGKNLWFDPCVRITGPARNKDGRPSGAKKKIPLKQRLPAGTQRRTVSRNGWIPKSRNLRIRSPFLCKEAVLSQNRGTFHFREGDFLSYDCPMTRIYPARFGRPRLQKDTEELVPGCSWNPAC